MSKLLSTPNNYNCNTIFKEILVSKQKDINRTNLEYLQSNEHDIILLKGEINKLNKNKYKKVNKIKKLGNNIEVKKFKIK